MVSALHSGLSGLGSSPGGGHCVVFLGKTLWSHSASLHPGVQLSAKLWPGGPFGLYADFLPFNVMP